MVSFEDQSGVRIWDGPVGSVTIEDRDEIGHRHVWTPGSWAGATLPPDFRLEMVELVEPVGPRRFAPATGTESFVLTASLGGLAVLGRLRDLSPEQRFTYDAMRLVYQHTPKLREHLARSFRVEADLRVPGSDRDVLPDRLGLDAAGEGRRWGVAELLRRGRESHPRSGEVSDESAIAAGLLAAARLDPIDPSGLGEADARTLVRMALFDLGPADGPLDPAVKEIVIARFLRLLERHIDDDPAEFDRWFLGCRDDLIRCIADQKKGEGPLEREVVRRALLELTWDSFTCVGDCVACQMAAFARSLPEPLGSDDRRFFDAFYARQPWLGGLPMILLRDRFAFSRGALLELMDEPADPRRVGVVLRILDYYAAMVGRRRQADREAKAKKSASRKPTTSRQASDATVRWGRTPEFFDAIAEELRGSRGIICECGSGAAWKASVKGDEWSDPLPLHLACSSCGREADLDVDREEFARVGRRMLGPAHAG